MLHIQGIKILNIDIYLREKIIHLMSISMDEGMYCIEQVRFSLSDLDIIQRLDSYIIEFSLFREVQHEY